MMSILIQIFYIKFFNSDYMCKLFFFFFGFEKPKHLKKLRVTNNEENYLDEGSFKTIFLTL